MAAALFIDQVTKFTAKNAGIPLHFNTGVSFGIFSGSGKFPAAVSFAVLMLLLAYIFSEKSRICKAELLFLSLTAGGAASNLADRLLLGHVVDWIPLPLSSVFFAGGLMFNAADAAIGAGALCAAAALFLRCSGRKLM